MKMFKKMYDHLKPHHIYLPSCLILSSESSCRMVLLAADSRLADPLPSCLICISESSCRMVLLAAARRTADPLQTPSRLIKKQKKVKTPTPSQRFPDLKRTLI